MLLQVRKQQFKEGFLDELEGKKDNLRSIGEQVRVRHLCLVSMSHAMTSVMSHGSQA